MKENKRTLRRLACFMLVLVCLMAMLAMPTSARTYRAYDGKGLYLNIWGDSVSQGSAVRLYAGTGHSTQDWSFSSAGNGYSYLVTNANKAYAINRDSSTSNAIMWTITSGSYDSTLSYSTYTRGTRFKLKNYSSGYLTSVAGYSSGSSAYFAALREGFEGQYWN